MKKIMLPPDIDTLTTQLAVQATNYALRIWAARKIIVAIMLTVIGDVLLTGTFVKSVAGLETFAQFLLVTAIALLFYTIASFDNKRASMFKALEADLKTRQRDKVIEIKNLIEEIKKEEEAELAEKQKQETAEAEESDESDEEQEGEQNETR